MSLMPWTDLPNSIRARLACGMTASELVVELKQERRFYQWPSTSAEWVDLMQTLADTTSSWEVVLGTVSGFVHPDSALAWHMIFEALQPLLASDAARFGFVGKLLRDHRDRKARGFIQVAMTHLLAARIHPASLLLSSYPTLDTRRVAALMQRMGEITCAARPLGFAESSWENGISQWDWAINEHGPIDGLVSSYPLFVWPDPRMANPAKVSRLGDRILIGGEFTLAQLPDLQFLGDDLHVYGDLVLQDLPNLCHLGSRIRVGGNIVIRHCPQLNMFPDTLEVGGLIYVSKDSNLLAHIPSEKACTAINPHPVRVECPPELDALVMY